MLLLRKEYFAKEMKDQFDCRNDCLANNKTCAGFTFFTNTKRCLLKSRKEDVKYNYIDKEMAVSGSLSCPGMLIGKKK